MERRKYLGHAYKDYYKTFTSRIVRLDEADIKGYAAHVEILEVNRPFIVSNNGAEICLANNGYSEISFLPDGENWKLSAVYDSRGKIVEWYIDITRKNSIDENGEPYCDDLYLDAALMPDGQILIFDEDELLCAYDNGSVTKTELDMAYHIMNELMEKKILSVAYMDKLCARLIALFKNS